MWWRLAWRNLWRNRKRTLITAAALAFGYVASVLMVGISDGTTVEMVENGTSLLAGQVQVHEGDWKPERGLYATLGGEAGTDVSALVRAVAAEPGVRSAAPRVYGGGLVSAGEQTVAAALVGVDPSLEPRVSRLLSTIVRGAAPRSGRSEIAIGDEMARKLHVSAGDEVVLVAPAADGSMGNDLFRVAGIYHTGMVGVDGAYAILPIGVLQRLLALDPGRVHEIAAAVPEPWQAPAVADSLAALLGRSGWTARPGAVAHAAASAAPSAAADPARSLEVDAWPTFRPELSEYARLADSSNILIVGIVFIMAIFGVANTMLMGTFERRREFAVVRALGTTGSGVSRTVLYEGLILGLLSLAGGAVLVAPLLVWFHHSPPDFSAVVGGFTMAGALIRPVLRVEYSVEAPLVSAGALLITALLAALYPAYRATRVPPADALAGR